MNEIAIASVPIQEWEEPWEKEKALFMGSIFPALHKPFFAEEEITEPLKPADGEEAALLLIQQTGFCLIDVSLFLDTHPGHTAAMQLKTQLLQQKKNLMAQFAKDYYPLTIICEGEEERCKIPWDFPGKGGNEHVAL